MGREVLHTEDFPSDGTFKAYYKAEERLRELGYTVGSMCGPEPIGFADSDQYSYIAKWYNIKPSERKDLDGVMIAPEGFREGGVQILFFTPRKNQKM